MTPIKLSRDQYIADDTANATARNEHALAFHPSMIKLGEEVVIVGNPAELLQLKGDPKLLSNRRRHCAPNPDVLHPARLQTRPRLPAATGIARNRSVRDNASGAFGNAATRLEAFVIKGGTYAYGNYPDIDALFQQQAVELDRKRRAAILDRMQELVFEKSIYAPIWLLALINDVGPRVGESGFGLIAGFAYTAPYEDITLKGAGG